MNGQLKEDMLMQMDLTERVSKPAIRSFSMERVRAEINKLASSCNGLSGNHELKALGNQFDELLDRYYMEEKATSL